MASLDGASEQIKPQRQGTEGTEDTIYVEIGAGAAPLLRSAVILSETHRELFKNFPSLKYFAVDVNEEDLLQGKERTEMLERMGVLSQGQMHYVKADGGQLPFKDSAVSQVLMKNVAGADYLGRYKRERMMVEAARILRVGGTLKIFETASPFAADAPIRFIRENLRDVFEEPEKGDVDLATEDFMDKTLLEQLPSAEEKFVVRFRKKAEMIPTSRLGALNEAEK